MILIIINYIISLPDSCLILYLFAITCLFPGFILILWFSILFTVYYLHVWLEYMIFWSSTRVLVCTRHLASFYILVGLLSDNLGPSYPDSRAQSVVDTFHCRSSFSCGATGPAITFPLQPPLVRLSRFSFAIMSILQLLYYVNHFVNRTFTPSGDVIFM